MYQSFMLIHVEHEMKEYVKGKYGCRRQFLMSHFQKTATCSKSGDSSDIEGICCDLCSKEADFLLPTAPAAAVYEGPIRSVSSESKKVLMGKLVMFRKRILLELLNHAPKGNLQVVSVPELIVGFSDQQITQVLDKSDKIFNISDTGQEKTHVRLPGASKFYLWASVSKSLVVWRASKIESLLVCKLDE